MSAWGVSDVRTHMSTCCYIIRLPIEVLRICQDLSYLPYRWCCDWEGTRHQRRCPSGTTLSDVDVKISGRGRWCGDGHEAVLAPLTTCFVRFDSFSSPGSSRPHTQPPALIHISSFIWDSCHPAYLFPGPRQQRSLPAPPPWLLLPHSQAAGRQ
jgi:hypothetical protein